MSVQDFTFHAYLATQDSEGKVDTFAVFLAQHGLTFESNHIALPDGGLSCTLQMYPARNHADVSIILLDCGGVYFDELLMEADESGTSLMMPFLQAWQTYMLWCRYLCEHVTPLFGVGFGLLEDRSGDIENVCAAALYDGRMPNLDAGVLALPPFAQYAGARFAGDQLIQDWYSAGYAVQQLVSRGAFAVSVQRQSTLFDADSQLHLLRYAQQLATAYIATRSPDTRTEIDHLLQRARAMKTTSGDDIIDAIRQRIS